MTEQNKLTIEEYVNMFSKDIQDILNKLFSLVFELVPEASMKISYQMPTFFFHENLVHFAAYKNHIGFYPTPSAIEAFKSQLSQYKWSKGAVQFPYDKPIPYSLIEQMVQFRVNEVKEKFEKERQ